jgi:urease subunit alpha
VLHDMGAISMMSSDSQAMGRVGEVILRTWQTAHKMSNSAATSPTRKAAPANATTTFASNATSANTSTRPGHGISREVGSIEVGKWADLVVWRPAFWRQTVFDHQRRLHHSWPPWATNASIPTPQPCIRPCLARLVAR